MPLKMNNEQKLKIPASIVSIACSALNTESITTTSTTTTPTTSAIPQTSAQKSSPSAASAASKSSLPRASASFDAASSSSSATAVACKSAYFAGTHSSPMSDAGAAAGQEISNAADSTEAALAALMKKDAPIITIANINNAANSSTIAASNSTPKVVATETTSNNNNINNSSSSSSSSSNTNADKSKKTELWEGSGLKDWDDSSLKNLLEEAYSYKTPRDKENKSEYFLQLLQNAENEKEDQTFAFRAIASRYTRNSTTSSASNSHKQGGSLQDLVEAVRNESLLDCDYQFGVGGQRNRRHNHNSRQKKYSSVSSRQREGGSLPSNVNVTYSGGSSLLGSALDQQTAPAFMHDVAKNNTTNNNSGSSSSGGNNKQQQRRNKASERTIAASLAIEKDCDSFAVFNSNSESGTTSTTLAGVASGVVAAASSAVSAINSVGGSSGDCVIEMGEPIIDIQQQQQILQAKGHDAATQGLPYYDRLDSIDMRIPRANVISSMQTKTDFAPTSAQCYVDEAVRFTTLERGVGGTGGGIGSGTNISTGSGVCSTACGQNKVSSSTIDTKYLPLDENYKSCKSVLGEKAELVKTPSTMFSTTKTIPRQFDEEIYQQSAASAIFNASTTSGHSSTISQSQAKAKNKKKSQQERNTKTVDVKSVAGYRGNDPVEVLVKYIESSEDKQNDKSTSNSNKFNENTKKRERKKDKEKQHKMKKSNSLEELRSCAKIDVDELKTSAATTESNVMMRSKSGKNKNNSASAADINKNYETKELTTASGKTLSATSPPSTTGHNNQRKGERRSWGTEELQYLGDSNSNNEERAVQTKDKKNKDKNKDQETFKERLIEKQDKNANSIDGNSNTSNNSTSNTVTTGGNSGASKLEKTEKRKKSEGNLHTAATLNTTTTTIAGNTSYNEESQTIDSSLLPEAAEFHVVTKKKKPKKQRASLDETNSSGSYTTGGVGGFQRSSNFMYNMQKSNNYVNGPQRYKYYNQQATNNDYMHSYNNNAAHNNNNQHVSDKSRRKSTSSMPPSEKSDSSDLDSVHSLPIESTTAATTTGISKNKQRHKNANVQTTAAVTTGANKITSGSANNVPAPISYADIARTNKEQQLTPTLGTQSSTCEKWPVVDYINNNVQPQNNLGSMTTECVPDVNNVDGTSSLTPQNGTLTPSNVIKQKTKKSTSKPDFPELVATLSSPTTVNNATATATQNETTKSSNIKQISYSQSLATVPTVPATITANNNDDLGIDVLVKEKSEKRFVSAAAANSETELTNLGLNSNMPGSYKHAQQSQQSQPPQQQILQKSKSVENESYNYTTNNFNGSNMDQQYPALEKTMKRHSAATVFNGSGANSTYLSSAKQSNCNNSNEECATTPSTPPTTKNFTTATSPNNQNSESVATVPCIKKVKEKSPSQNIPLSNETSPMTNSNLVAAATTVARKSKKEKPMHQINDLPPCKSTTTATQTASAYPNNVSRSNAASSVEISNKKPTTYNSSTHTKLQSKTHSLSRHSSGGGSAACNAVSTANRPAVIILNDDRSAGSYAASNEFTFGDFNEDELKFFDDDVVASSSETIDDEDVYDEENEEDVDVEAESNKSAVAENVSTTDLENLSYVPARNVSSKEQQTSTLRRGKTSPTAANAQRIFFNDSGTNFNTTSASSSSSASDIGTCVLNNSAPHSDELLLLSGADSSSPNTSALVGANQSSDSGIYTSNKTKNNSEYNRVTTKSDSVADVVVNSNSNSNSHSTDSTITTNKLNAFLNKSPDQNSSGNNGTSSVGSSNSTRNKQTTPTNGTTSSRITIKQNSISNVTLPPPQQLETCNEIETAIIAAAKAAAAVEHQQHIQQHQQHNFNSSASSSFSSSSSVSNESKYSSYQSQQQQNQFHRHHNHQQQQQQHHHQSYHHNHRPYNQHPEDAEAEHARSRSNSSQRDVAIVVRNMQHKEMDCNFISPSMSSLQHNDIIIDFIGSAWEEVAKVTKFYDEQ